MWDKHFGNMCIWNFSLSLKILNVLSPSGLVKIWLIKLMWLLNEYHYSDLNMPCQSAGLRATRVPRCWHVHTQHNHCLLDHWKPQQCCCCCPQQIQGYHSCSSKCSSCRLCGNDYLLVHLDKGQRLDGDSPFPSQTWKRKHGQMDQESEPIHHRPQQRLMIGSCTVSISEEEFTPSEHYSRAMISE